jgi:hypothetical protein
LGEPHILYSIAPCQGEHWGRSGEDKSRELLDRPEVTPAPAISLKADSPAQMMVIEVFDRVV